MNMCRADTVFQVLPEVLDIVGVVNTFNPLFFAVVHAAVIEALSSKDAIAA